MRFLGFSFHFSHQKTSVEKGSKPHWSKREFGIFILKGERMKMFCLLLAYDYILTKKRKFLLCI
ncbi:hypothetical protein GFS76_13110 [Listeria monocytogenes]|uniref:Uncharacterized protein n=2 Tax=Listeria monocytogenes TaxID=1639 RepID=A0A6C8EGA1_LISMN